MKIIKNKLRFGDIVAESYYRENNNGKAVVFCAGIPGISSYPDIAERYAAAGYIFIHPKYVGSWESYGGFSVEGCKKTIIDFVAALRQKQVKTIFGDIFNVVANKIYLLGHSFGGSVALSAGAELEDVGIIALAPVIDYKKQGNGEYLEEKMDCLGNFILAGFENVYRGFDQESWNTFCISGAGLNANEYIDKLKSRDILLIHGRSDTSVNFNRSKEFVNELKAQGGRIEYVETDDDHSGVKSSSFEKIVSWIK